MSEITSDSPSDNLEAQPIVAEEDFLLPNGESCFSVRYRLRNMMEMSKIIIFETMNLAKFSHMPKICQHRANAVRWIKDVIIITSHKYFILNILFPGCYSLKNVRRDS